MNSRHHSYAAAVSAPEGVQVEKLPVQDIDAEQSLFILEFQDGDLTTFKVASGAIGQAVIIEILDRELSTQSLLLERGEYLFAGTRRTIGLINNLDPVQGHGLRPEIPAEQCKKKRSGHTEKAPDI